MWRYIYKRLPFTEERRRSVELDEVTTENRLRGNFQRDHYLDLIVANKVDDIIVPDTILNKVDGVILKKPILLYACEGKGDFHKVNGNTIKQLIKNGAQLDYIDQEWYGWEALHYAAAASNPEKLQIICDKFNQEKQKAIDEDLEPVDGVNTLTMLSENALHILLQHCTSAESFMVSCQNGLDSRMSQIVNEEPDSVIASAAILIDANIDYNHTNFWNESPILIAIKRKYFGVVKLLLKKQDIDLDSCKDAVSGRTAREFLKGRTDLGNLPAPTGLRSEKILFHLLKSGDEENFLKYNRGEIECVNNLDGDIEDNSSCTLLQYCFRRGLIFWYHDKETYDCELQFPYQDITANRMVQIFCQSGMAKCIQHLLDNGADPDFSLRKFEGGRTLLEAGIIKGFYPLVALILGRNDKLSTEKIVKICKAMNMLLENNNVSNIDLNNTLSVVLNRLIDCSDIPEIIPELKGVLKTGVRDINKDNLLLLLKFPGSLVCEESERKKSVLEEIDPEILKAHLSDCVEQEGKEVCINCISLLKDSSIQSTFRTLLSSPALEESLNHLVFKILIMRHWEHLRFRWQYFRMKYFYVNFFFYVFFYVILNLYILCKFNNTFNMFLYVSGWVCLAIFIAKELFQLLANHRLYLKEKSNCCELPFIICTAIVFSYNGKFVDVFEVLSILSSNLVLLFLLVSVPACAKYIIILQIIIYYLRFIFFYFIQFFAFAVCFYILFAKSDQIVYIDLPNKIFETIILFTGNLDYMETPWTQDSPSNGTSADTLYHDFQYKEVLSKVVFIIFVLFIAVILQNLLLGLLVIDMGNINKDGELSEQVKRASFVVRIETFFNSTCMQGQLMRKILQYDAMKVGEKITVDNADRKILSDEEKQNLDFILTKKTKKPNVLRKLCNYIRIKVNERSCGQRNKKNKELFEKLEMIEEIIKNLHETGDLKKKY